MQAHKIIVTPEITVKINTYENSVTESVCDHIVFLNLKSDGQYKNKEPAFFILIF